VGRWGGRVEIGSLDAELAIKNVEKCTIEILNFVWCAGIFWEAIGGGVEDNPYLEDCRISHLNR
jgi:hypothetical protein